MDTQVRAERGGSGGIRSCGNLYLTRTIIKYTGPTYYHNRYYLVLSRRWYTHTNTLYCILGQILDTISDYEYLGTVYRTTLDHIKSTIPGLVFLELKDMKLSKLFKLQCHACIRYGHVDPPSVEAYPAAQHTHGGYLEVLYTTSHHRL